MFAIEHIEKDFLETVDMPLQAKSFFRPLAGPKCQASAERIPMRRADPATAHLFIVNPLSGRSLSGLFSTHPPLEKRIERLLSWPH